MAAAPARQSVEGDPTFRTSGTRYAYNALDSGANKYHPAIVAVKVGTLTTQ